MPATLLCVQKDRELGQLYAEALTAEGYEVLRAHDGRGALDILRRQNPSLIVLDIYLPRQDGFEILAEMRMRPESKTLPVLLFCDGDVTDEISARARKLGAIGNKLDLQRRKRLPRRNMRARAIWLKSRFPSFCVDSISTPSTAYCCSITGERKRRSSCGLAGRCR